MLSKIIVTLALLASLAVMAEVGPATCPSCRGLGGSSYRFNSATNRTEEVKCIQCRGTGIVHVEKSSYFSNTSPATGGQNIDVSQLPVINVKLPCSICGGNGSYKNREGQNKTCGTCRGSGYVYKRAAVIYLE